jgi:outer membrane protein assembly factor BamA
MKRKRSNFRIPLFLLCALASCFAVSTAQITIKKPVVDSLADLAIFTVDSVLITGNKDTKDFVILREMALKPGSPITEHAMHFDEERLYSTGLFTRVNIDLVPTSPGKANIIVTVREGWWILPAPFVGFRDGDWIWRKLYFGGDISDINFRGRRETVDASAAFGYDPSKSLSYSTPFLDDSGKYFLQTRIGYNRVTNKSLRVLTSDTESFDEYHFTPALTLGKRFTNSQSASISTAFNMVDVRGFTPAPGTQTSLSTPPGTAGGIDRYMTFAAGYAFDTRDLSQYPTQGSYDQFSVTKYGLPGHIVNYVRYNADVREFQPLFDHFVLATRAVTDIAAAGPTPSYDHLYTYYNYNVRGHYRDVDEGEDILGFTAEIHHPIFDTRYVKFGNVPPQLEAFDTWRIGLGATVFVDAAQVWFRGQPVAINRSFRGYGCGLDLLLGYAGILRAFVARNELNKTSVGFAAGAEF